MHNTKRFPDSWLVLVHRGTAIRPFPVSTCFRRQLSLAKLWGPWGNSGDRIIWDGQFGTKIKQVPLGWMTYRDPKNVLLTWITIKRRQNINSDLRPWENHINHHSQVWLFLPVGRDSQSKTMKSQWVGLSKVRVQGTQVDPIKYIYI